MPARAWLISALVFVLGAAAGFGGAVLLRDEVAPPPEPGTSWLFVLSADTGSLEESGGGFRLALSGVHENIVAFTDRPARVSTRITTAGFLSLFGEGGTFQDSPPNAELEMVLENGQRKLVTVELLTAEGTSDVTFEVVGVGDAKLAASEFVHPTLFVDSVGLAQSCQRYTDARANGECARAYNQGVSDRQSGFWSDVAPGRTTTCALASLHTSQPGLQDACFTGYNSGWSDAGG